MYLTLGNHICLYMSTNTRKDKRTKTNMHGHKDTSETRTHALFHQHTDAKAEAQKGAQLKEPAFQK